MLQSEKMQEQWDRLLSRKLSLLLFGRTGKTEDQDWKGVRMKLFLAEKVKQK